MGAGRATVSHPNSDFGENSSLRPSVLGKMTLSNPTPCTGGGGCGVPNAGSSRVIFSLKEALYLEHSGRNSCIDGFHEIRNHVNHGRIADRGIKHMGLADIPGDRSRATAHSETIHLDDQRAYRRSGFQTSVKLAAGNS